MSAIQRLSDIEGGPYAPVTEDEFDSAAEIFKERVFNAMRAFLINTNADNQSRKEIEVMMDASIAEIVDEMHFNTFGADE